MMYALNLDENGRILSATYDKYAPEGQPRVEALPDGNIADYLFIGGGFVYDPLPGADQPDDGPTQDERIAAIETQLAAYEAAYAEGVNEA